MVNTPKYSSVNKPVSFAIIFTIRGMSINLSGRYNQIILCLRIPFILKFVKDIPKYIIAKYESAFPSFVNGESNNEGRLNPQNLSMRHTTYVAIMGLKKNLSINEGRLAYKGEKKGE